VTRGLGRIGALVLEGAAVAAAAAAASILHAQAVSVPVQETPLSRDPRLLETIDGELLFAGIVDERSPQIAQALRVRDYERAETLLLQAAEAHPGSADVLRTLGGVFFLRGRPLNAAIAFNKADKVAPLDERSRFTLVMAYVALGRRDWARPELAKLAAAAPAKALYPYWTARLDQDDGQYAAAVAGLQRATQLDRNYMKAYDNLGLCYEALGRFDDAERSFEEALRLNRAEKPGSPWPALNLGLLLTRLDRTEAAEARFRESLAADPRFPQARYQLGVALEKRGRVAEALHELEEAARLDPDYAEPQYALARVYRRSGDKERADRALARFLEIKAQKEREKNQAAPKQR
jgi:tetratricopeptide (TPR) repeat protein